MSCTLEPLKPCLCRVSTAASTICSLRLGRGISRIWPVILNLSSAATSACGRAVRFGGPAASPGDFSRGGAQDGALSARSEGRLEGSQKDPLRAFCLAAACGDHLVPRLVRSRTCVRGRRSAILTCQRWVERRSETPGSCSGADPACLTTAWTTRSALDQGQAQTDRSRADHRREGGRL